MKAMPEYESEQDAIRELVTEFPAVPARIIGRVLHAYLETTADLERATDATRERISDALRG
ncbi:MAG TPA: hypothetical protein VGH43_13170 [Jatrophihabitans sp.]